MEDAFGTVLWVVVIVGAVVAIVTFATSGGVWERIGRDGLALDDSPAVREPGGAAGAALREEEIRQMLEARNARRARRGEAPIDVDAELAMLLRPSVDPGLEAEIRDLVEARNARRIRRGQEPLDVEAEIARQIRDLTV